MMCTTEIEKTKRMYAPGIKVRLLKMNDFQAPPIGTEGIVKGVDDAGSIMVIWDNGSRLNVNLDVDEVEIVSGGGIYEESKSEIYTLYSQEGDITFVMEDKEKSTSVVGFYYGEPNEKATKIFRGKLTAYFE